MSGRVWRIALTTSDAEIALLLAQVFEDFAPAVSVFEASPPGTWRVEAFAPAAPDRPRLAAALAVASAAAGDADLAAGLVIELVPDRDWLAENQASFPPLRTARFFVHGSHFRERPPPGLLPIRVDATTAFGTGEHATTRGCLVALAQVAARRPLGRVLDMGTGTGILAIAAARLGARSVAAFDSDAGSVRVAAANLAANGVRRRVTTRVSNGYRRRGVGRGYDVVLANILARPLALMARDLGVALAPGGVAILSGLLARQEPLVLAAHRSVGLTLRRRIVRDGWHTLVLRRG